MRFDHVGIVAPTLEGGTEALECCFPITAFTREFADPVNRVYVQFGRDTSGICYELAAARRRLCRCWSAQRRHNMLNHVAYLVDDLSADAARLRRGGVVPAGRPQPAIAYGNHPIQFFVTPLRFISEMIEAPNHQHAFQPQFESDCSSGLARTGVNTDQ